MKKSHKYFSCKFCNKTLNPSLLVQFLIENRCCKECFKKGQSLFNSAIGQDVVDKMGDGSVFKIKQALQ